jgi:hypothetical protein
MKLVHPMDICWIDDFLAIKRTSLPVRWEGRTCCGGLGKEETQHLTGVPPCAFVIIIIAAQN